MSAPQPRVALIVTGHLRSTCATSASRSLLERQAVLCRESFGGRCDLFVHTWDTLDRDRTCADPGCGKRRAAAATPSWDCMSALIPTLLPAGVTVERQDRAANLSADARMFNGFETLQSVRMQAAGMYGGVQLAVRHATAMGHIYDASVRIRADVGAMPASWRMQLLNDRFAWLDVKRAADAEYSRRSRVPELGIDGTASQRQRCGHLYVCDRPRHPRLKRGEICLWSAPAWPLWRSLEALATYELTGEPARETTCRDWLNSSVWGKHLRQYGGSVQRIPLHTENLLLCAMRHVGASFPWWGC